MWKPESEKKPVCRLTGHQATINDVKFSPDARYIASASFDKSVCIGVFTLILISEFDSLIIIAILKKSGIFNDFFWAIWG